MINWLNCSNLRFALIENPIIDRNQQIDFWGSTQFVDDVNGQRLEVTMLGREIEITEHLILTSLHLNDDFA